MFDPASRYFTIENATLLLNNTEEQDEEERDNDLIERKEEEQEQQRIIIYKKRRFIPLTQKITVFQEMTTMAADRLDNISARVFGDPLLFWHICDANDIMHPLELTEKPGNSIRLPLPGNST